MSIQTIDVNELSNRMKQDAHAILIDVRSPAEYDAAHVDRSVLLPLDRLAAVQVEALRHGDDAPVYVMCKAGVRADQACRKLAAEGVGNLVLVTGGLDAWRGQGLPVICGKPAGMPVMQQVQLTIGTAVVAGAALAWFINPAWVVLCAAMGAGMMMAGMTGLCPLASLIGAMPWNKATESCCATKPSKSCCGKD